MSNFQLNVKINGADQTVKSIGEIENALKATKEELKGLEVGSEAFEKMALQARLLQDELKGSFQQATDFDQSLNQLTESVTRLGTSVAAGFALATTAFSMFGKESEEVSQAQIKAQQALTIAFGATTIATNAAKMAGDIKLVTDRLQLGITNLMTSALGKEAIAKSAVAVATGTATVAQRALNAAMMANPILLLVGALGLLVGALITFNSSSDDAVVAQRDLNEEIEKSSKLIENEIKVQRELIRLRGRVAEAEAETEAERLRVRQSTQAQLDEIDIEDTERRIENNRKILQDEVKSNSFRIALTRATLDRVKDLQDFNVDAFVTQEDRRRVALEDSFNEGKIAIEDYIEKLKELDQVNGDNVDEDVEAQRQRTQDIIDEQRRLIAQLKIANESKEANERLSNLELERLNRESFRKRREAQDGFNQNQVNSIQKRNDEIKKIEREFEDFLINRISEGLVDITEVDGVIELIERSAESFALVNTESGRVIKNLNDLTEAERETASVITVNNEDIIKGYDERITQLQFLKDRQISDAEEIFNRDIENFRKTEEARKDANGNRIITDAQINAAIAEQTDKFNQEQEARAVNFSRKIEAITQERADKIQEIEEILQQEIAFGDNSTNDNRTALLLESIDLEIAMAQRRIESERRINIELLRERQNAEAKKRAFLRQNLLEQEEIELTLALKSVQGTEEQKARQREELVKASNERIKRINDDFRSQEEAATAQSAQEILDAQLQKLQEYAQAVSSILNQIMSLTNAIQEGNKIALDQQLADIRDSYQEQKNIVTESYNSQMQSLNEKYQNGLISQEEYNAGVKDLNTMLAEEELALENEKREIELDLKEKAFEDEKKMKIASAVIAGVQGALQAFAGAMQLGPIAGPIVGGILAALVGATTATSIANIKKQKFDRGAPASTPKLGGVSGGSGAASAVQNMGSEGGLTQFNSELVGPPTVDGITKEGKSAVDGRVYVLESDIRAVQNRVNAAENSATFG